MDRSHRLTPRQNPSDADATAFRRRASATLVAALGVVLSLAPGCSTAPRSEAKSAPARAVAAPLTADQRDLNLASFDQVWTTIQDKHFDPQLNGADWPAARAELRPKVESATSMAEVRTALADLISRLKQTHFGIIPADAYDPATDPVAPPAESKVAAAATSKPAKKADEGYLGLEIRAIDGKAVVTRVTPGSPADAAGVKPGWEFVSRGARPVRPVLARVAARPTHLGLPLAAIQALTARSLLSVHPGETLHLGFLDGSNKAVVASLTAVTPPGAPVAFGNLPTTHLRLEKQLLPSGNGGGVGYMYVSIWLDPTRTINFVQEAVAEFHNADGIIIDLRGNPGGLGGIAPAMAGFFVTERNKELGTMITRQYKQKFIINPRPNPYTGPVAVLVDELSMSTSEIFAGGMQDIGRARLFGTPTPGAALPSAIERLPNGDRFQYAFANYLSASGKVLEGKGVTPDETVLPTRRALLAGGDPALDTAKAWIATQRHQRPAVSTVSP